MKTETMTLNGQTFFVRSWGDPGLPTLLMLHGFPEYGGAWSDLAPFLAERFHCIAPDQRGYGQSWSPPGVAQYSVAELVGDMAALIEAVGGPVHVLGHDWGAAVAYGLAMFRPDLVSRLIILNGVHPVPFQTALSRGGAQAEASQYIHMLRRPDSQDLLAQDNYARLEKLFSAKMSFDWLTPERRAEYLAEWARPGRLETMINWYRASPLQVPEPGQVIADPPQFPIDKMHVPCPHLLIWGEDDTALLPEATEGLEAFVPDLTRVTMHGVDHWLCHQAPDQVAGHILNWINKRETAA